MSGRADGLNDIFDNSVKIKKNLDVDSGTITKTPTINKHIVNKEYVDGEVHWEKTGTNVHLKTSTDNVGIGTATPGDELHVIGNMAIDNSGGNTSLYFKDGATDEWHLARVDSGNRLSITESGVAENMTFIPGGNIGINTITPDTKLQVVGDFKTGDDNTNYVTIDATGNQVFVGGGGLCFAGISFYNNTTADTIATATLAQLARFDTNDPNNNCTPDHTNDHITITKAGMYYVSMDVSFSGTGSVEWTGGAYKNNGGTQLSNIQTSRKLGASGDVGSAGVSGIADLAVNDTIEIWFQHAAGVNKNITVKHCTLSVMQIGGT